MDLVKEPKQVYHDLVTGQQGRTRRRTEPQNLGYAKDEAPREMMAEALRAYMVDPNYLESVAPKTAKRICECANTDPDIAPFRLLEIDHFFQFSRVQSLLRTACT